MAKEKKDIIEPKDMDVEQLCRWLIKLFVVFQVDAGKAVEAMQLLLKQALDNGKAIEEEKQKLKQESEASD